MDLKKWLTSRVANDEDRALVTSFIATYQLGTLAEVRGRLASEIEKCRTFLASAKYYGTIQHKRKEYTRKLEYLMRMKQALGK